MHTGQIVLLTKIYAPGKIHFYEDAGGLAPPDLAPGNRARRSRALVGGRAAAILHR